MHLPRIDDVAKTGRDREHDSWLTERWRLVDLACGIRRDREHDVPVAEAPVAGSSSCYGLYY